MKKKIVWFARGGGIARCGPFPDQLAATNAMRLVKRAAKTQLAGDFRKGRAVLALVHLPAQRAEFPDDVFVWPEEATDRLPKTPTPKRKACG